MIPRYKLVIVGDGACGKTSLLTVFSTGNFPIDYVPTVFETSVKQINLDDTENNVIELTLWDTAGQESYEKLRPLSYSNTDVVLICYAIDNVESLCNVENHWVLEVRHYCHNTPIILVGNKSDLRDISDDDLKEKKRMSKDNMVSKEEGARLGERISASAFVECSAKYKLNVDKVFNKACHEAIRRRMANGSIKVAIRRKCLCL